MKNHTPVTTPLLAAIGLAFSLSVTAADMPRDNGVPMKASPKGANETAGPVGGTPPGSDTGPMKGRKSDSGMNSTQDKGGMSSSSSPKSANETPGAMGDKSGMSSPKKKSSDSGMKS